MRTTVRTGGRFCCNFVANLLKYLCAKNYKNIVRFDKVIAKIIGVQFFLSHSVYYNILAILLGEVQDSWHLQS